MSHLAAHVAAILLRIAHVLICFWAITAPPVVMASSEPIEINVPVLPDIARHTDLLSKPSYLLLALSNSGVNQSNFDNFVFVDAETAKFPHGTIHFIRQNGSVFFYDARVMLNSKGIGSVTVKVEIDTSNVKSGAAGGNLRIRLYFPLAALVPEGLRNVAKSKLARANDQAIQRNVFEYLDSAVKRGKGGDGKFEIILVDAYNYLKKAKVTTQVVKASQEGYVSYGNWIAMVAVLLIISSAMMFFWNAIAAFRKRHNQHRT